MSECYRGDSTFEIAAIITHAHYWEFTYTCVIWNSNYTIINCQRELPTTFIVSSLTSLNKAFSVQNLRIMFYSILKIEKVLGKIEIEKN